MTTTSYGSTFAVSLVLAFSQLQVEGQETMNRRSAICVSPAAQLATQAVGLSHAPGDVHAWAGGCRKSSSWKKDTLATCSANSAAVFPAAPERTRLLTAVSPCAPSRVHSGY
jgi:hypothetical protein